MLPMEESDRKGRREGQVMTSHFLACGLYRAGLCIAINGGNRGNIALADHGIG
jgi:hypothetical protein